MGEWGPFSENHVWDLLLDDVAGNSGAREALVTYVSELEGDIPPKILALREALKNPSSHKERTVSRVVRSAKIRVLATVLKAGAGRIVFDADVKQGAEAVPKGETYRIDQMPFLVGALLGLKSSRVNQLRSRNKQNVARVALEQFGLPKISRRAGEAEDKALSERVKEYLDKHPGQVVLPNDYDKIVETPFFEFLTAPTFSPLRRRTFKFSDGTRNYEVMGEPEDVFNYLLARGFLLE